MLKVYFHLCLVYYLPDEVRARTWTFPENVLWMTRKEKERITHFKVTWAVKVTGVPRGIFRQRRLGHNSKFRVYNMKSGSSWPFLFSLSAVAIAGVMNRDGRRRVVLNLDACRDLLVHRSHLDIECRFTCCLVWNSKLLPIPRHCLSLKISGLPRW